MPEPYDFLYLAGEMENAITQAALTASHPDTDWPPEFVADSTPSTPAVLDLIEDTPGAFSRWIEADIDLGDDFADGTLDEWSAADAGITVVADDGGNVADFGDAAQRRALRRWIYVAPGVNYRLFIRAQAPGGVGDELRVTVRSEWTAMYLHEHPTPPFADWHSQAAAFETASAGYTNSTFQFQVPPFGLEPLGYVDAGNTQKGGGTPNRVPLWIEVSGIDGARLSQIELVPEVSFAAIFGTNLKRPRHSEGGSQFEVDCRYSDGAFFDDGSLAGPLNDVSRPGWTTFAAGFHRWWRIAIRGRLAYRPFVGAWVLGTARTLSPMLAWGWTEARALAQSRARSTGGDLHVQPVGTVPTTATSWNLQPFQAVQREELLGIFEACRWGTEPFVAVPLFSEAPAYHGHFSDGGLPITRQHIEAASSVVDFIEDPAPRDFTVQEVSPGGVVSKTQILEGGIVGKWEGEDTLDGSGNGNHLATNIGTGFTFTPGLLGNALTSDGINTAKRTVADGLSVINEFGIGSFAIGQKVRLTDVTGGRMLHRMGDVTSGQPGYKLLEDAGGDLNFHLGDGTTTIVTEYGGTLIQVNTWHSVFVVVNRTLQRLYFFFDGDEQAPLGGVNISSLLAVSNATRNFGIGMSPDSNGAILAGKLDQNFFWGPAASFFASFEHARQAAHAYHGTTPGQPPVGVTIP